MALLCWPRVLRSLAAAYKGADLDRVVPIRADSGAEQTAGDWLRPEVNESECSRQMPPRKPTELLTTNHHAFASFRGTGAIRKEISFYAVANDSRDVNIAQAWTQAPFVYPLPQSSKSLPADTKSRSPSRVTPSDCAIPVGLPQKT